MSDQTESVLIHFARLRIEVWGRDESCRYNCTVASPNNEVFRTCYGLRDDDTDGWRRKPCDMCESEEQVARLLGHKPREDWN